MRARLEIACLLIPLLAAGGCSPRQEAHEPVASNERSTDSASFSASAPTPAPSSAPEPFAEVGTASWYGRAFAGRRTSNGERFDPKLFTAAHKKLPFGTWVEVRRIDNGRTVRVRINDRGPNGAAAHRIIDLSEHAAAELDMLRAGVAQVEIRVVPAQPKR